MTILGPWHQSASRASSGRARNGAAAASARNNPAGEFVAGTGSANPTSSTDSTIGAAPACWATSWANCGSDVQAVTGMLTKRRLSKPAGSSTTIPVSSPLQSSPAPDMPAHRDPSGSGPAGGLVASTAYRLALTSAFGFTSPSAPSRSRPRPPDPPSSACLGRRLSEPEAGCRRPQQR